MNYKTAITGPTHPGQVVLYEGSSLKQNQNATSNARKVLCRTKGTGSVFVYSAGSVSIYHFENGEERQSR